MKLASLKSKDPGNRDGDLVVVSRDNNWAIRTDVAPTLIAALRTWNESQPKLDAVFRNLQEKKGDLPGAFRLDLSQCLAPIPNAPGFYDGSAFLSHVVRARKARGDQMPESAKVTPLMYQGVSDGLLPFQAPIELIDEKFGGDFEGEFAILTTDVPRGTPADRIEPYCALFTLFNDITLREIVKTEIETKFGFLQSKPNSSFAPFAVTADELGEAWKDGRVHLPLHTHYNEEWFGSPVGTEMHFSFFQLIAHACRTRPLSAGSIVGTGTVSNEDKTKGFTCLTEKRFQEILDGGKPVTPWLKPGDRVRMDVMHGGHSLFGPIDEKVTL